MCGIPLRRGWGQDGGLSFKEGKSEVPRGVSPRCVASRLPASVSEERFFCGIFGRISLSRMGGCGDDRVARKRRSVACGLNVTSMSRFLWVLADSAK